VAARGARLAAGRVAAGARAHATAAHLRRLARRRCEEPCAALIRRVFRNALRSHRALATAGLGPLEAVMRRMRGAGAVVPIRAVRAAEDELYRGAGEGRVEAQGVRPRHVVVLPGRRGGLGERGPLTFTVEGHGELGALRPVCGGDRQVQLRVGRRVVVVVVVVAVEGRAGGVGVDFEIAGAR
jgi:hypothetical protein